MKARLIENPPAPGSPEWLTRMSASKIAAVVGLSPYESRYSLWMKMAGLVPPQPQTAAMSRGHYLEPAIRAWFADQHDVWDVTPGASYVSEDRDWQAAAPDGFIFKTSHGDEPDALLEIKTAADSTEWGEAGTDQIPVGYKCQVQWQLDTLGLDTAYVAVLLPFLEFREYVVKYDEADATYLRTEAQAFMDSLAARERPDVDDHDATYQALRQVNPTTGAGDIEVAAHIADDYLTACADHKDATSRKQLATSRLFNLLAECDARRATYNGAPIAYRQAGRNGAPAFLKASPTTKAAA